MTQIKLTDRAKDDLSEIYDYSIEQWGENVANDYLLGIESALKLLSQNKELLIQNKKISSRFRCYRYQKHWLICEVLDGAIIVLTVLHTSMNVLENLRKLEPSLEQECNILFQRLKK